ncbi:hypothetical protein HDU81_011167 [Chytriomyces hyalinus]|nr:hypothetical protein HDU81_011167 [Chytriomyces hyalinus]
MMANIDETLDASLDIARLSIADSNDATVPLSYQPCTSDEVDERDAEIKKLRGQLECERSLRQNAEKQLESCKQPIQNQDIDQILSDIVFSHLKTELRTQNEIHQSLFERILVESKQSRVLQPETLVRIIFQMPTTLKRRHWLQSIFSQNPFNGYETLITATGSVITEIEISNTFTKEYLTSKPFWLSVGSGDCSFEKALVRLTGSSFSRGRHAVGPSSPNWKKPHYAAGVPGEVQFKINARKISSLGTYKLPKDAAIIFNCPWDGNFNIGKLIFDVMDSAFNKQSIGTGSYFFLGITECKEYFKRYHLSDVLTRLGPKYRLTHIDNGLIGDVRLEYQFHSDSNRIEDAKFILDKHVMLCFRHI